MSQPDTLEEFYQWLDTIDPWDLESDVLKIGEPEEPNTGSSTKCVESDLAGGDDNDSKGQRRVFYTEHQIQGLRALFEKFPRPNREQRDEISQRLGLSSLQIRLWCENRRRKLKGRHTDLENVLLRAEVEKLQAENARYKEALGNPCLRCGGETTSNERHLMVENDRLKDHLDMIVSIASKYVKNPSASIYSHLPSSSRTPRRSQAQSSPMETMPTPSDERGMHHPEWSYPGNELATIFDQFISDTPKL